MYQYDLCGLPNVYLTNGYRTHRTEWGESVAVTDAHGLHAALGRAIVGKAGTLAGDEVRFLRREMGLSQAALADAMGCEEQTISLWERRGKITAPADRLLRALYTEHVSGSVTVGKLLAGLRIADESETVARFTLTRGRTWRVAG